MGRGLGGVEGVRGERAEGSYIMTKWKRPDAQVCINFDLVPPNGREVPHRPADWGDGDYAGNSSDATKFGVVKKIEQPDPNGDRIRFGAPQWAQWQYQ